MDKKLSDCLTLEELRETFTLEELMSFALDMVLQDWMREHLLESQAEMLADKNLSRDAFFLRLCEALTVDVTKLSAYESDLVTRALRRERERAKRESECGSDGVIVTNQRELVAALRDKNVHKVYLYNETFSIPLHRSNITYDGRGNALINVMTQGDNVLDFDGQGIYFYNVTLVFHFLEPHQVRVNHSSQNHNHIIYLRANRVTSDHSVSPQEMADFLAGRTPFETAEGFAKRAEKFNYVIVGKVYLNDRDYDLWHQAFFLNPVWRIEFGDPLYRYVHGARLVFPIPSDKAEALYENERAQLIYADFGTEKDDGIIKRLYLHTKDGQGEIYLIHRLWYATSWAFGSGSGGAGYGLNLIEYYD